MADCLKIGWSEIDTTPEGNVELMGQYYQRVSRGLHSRLGAVALALDTADTQAVLVSVDVAMIPEEFRDALRERLASKLPFDARSVILNAIHTHNAPGLTEIVKWWTPDPDAVSGPTYRPFLLDRLEQVVLDAWNHRRAGGIAHGRVTAAVGHCRRAVYTDGTAEMYGRTDRDDFAGMEGGEDAGVELLFSFDQAGRPTGAIVNVACPAQVMESTYVISSDYMGRLRELMKQRFGDAFRTLCQIAPAGDQSPRDLTRYDATSPLWREAGVEQVATRLMQAIDAGYDNIAARIDNAPLRGYTVRNLALPRRRVTYPEFLRARRALAELETRQSTDEAYRAFCDEVHRNEKSPNRPGPYDDKLMHFVRVQNNQAVVRRYEDQDDSPTFTLELHALRLGEAVLVTNPFELYLEFGQRIRARSRAAATFMVQLCNGQGGYLPSRRAEELGGYGGMIINGHVGADGGALLVDETITAINRLFRNNG